MGWHKPSWLGCWELARFYHNFCFVLLLTHVLCSLAVTFNTVVRSLGRTLLWDLGRGISCMGGRRLVSWPIYGQAIFGMGWVGRDRCNTNISSCPRCRHDYHIPALNLYNHDVLNAPVYYCHEDIGMYIWPGTVTRRKHTGLR